MHIPEGWENLVIDDIIDKILDFRGRTPLKLGLEWGNGEIPALSAKNVRSGYIDFRKECYLGDDKLYDAWMTKGHLAKGDVLFTMEAPLGNVAQIPNDRKYILSQRVISFKTKNNTINDFFKYLLMSQRFQKELDTNATGTTAKGIQQKRLIELPILLPPLPEQEKIAEILSTCDEGIEATDKQIAKLKDLKKAMMQELLTKGIDHKEFKESPLGKIPKSWKVVKLDSISKVIDSLHRTPVFVAEGYPMVRVADIKEGKLSFAKTLKVSKEEFIAFTKNHMPSKGNIVLSRVGSYGVSSYVSSNQKFCMGQNTVVIEPRINNKFLYYCLNSSQIRKQIENGSFGSGYKSLSLANIKDLLIQIPCPEEQKKIANILSSIDDNIESKERKLSRLKDQKKALMNDLLTGKVRV